MLMLPFGMHEAAKSALVKHEAALERGAADPVQHLLVPRLLAPPRAHERRVRQKEDALLVVP